MRDLPLAALRSVPSREHVQAARAIGQDNPGCGGEVQGRVESPRDKTTVGGIRHGVDSSESDEVRILATTRIHSNHYIQELQKMYK